MVSVTVGVLVFKDSPTFSPKPVKASTYLNTPGARTTDSCGDIRVAISEPQACPRLTQDTGVACVITNPTGKNNLNSYTMRLTISSNDGQPHTIRYLSATNFCNNGYLRGSASYCTCVDNEQNSGFVNLAIPATGSQVINLTRSSPTGANCGSYQYDFGIFSVDGNNSCTFKHLNGVDISGASAGCETGTTCAGPTTYTIAGAVFIDKNRNGVKDTGEVNYAGTPDLATNRGTVSESPLGTYVLSGPTAGNVTVSYPNLPAGYSLTYPLNGPPASYTVTVGPGCATNGATGASCQGGNIMDLNFGITDTNPWIQTICGSMRLDDGITNRIPSTATGGAYGIITNAALCTTPGIAYTGDSVATWGAGSASTNNWVVGGTVYPEVYTPSSSTGLTTSPEYLLAKATQTANAPINLATVCTLSNCTLPGNLPHGIYQANGNVNLNTTTIPANQNYIFIINGTLTIRGNIIVPIGSTAVFSTTDDILVEGVVGYWADVPTAAIEGIFSTNKSFIVLPHDDCICHDLRLNIAGAVIVNAAGTGGSFQNRRDVLEEDVWHPTVAFSPRLDFLFNLPDFVRLSSQTSFETAP